MLFFSVQQELDCISESGRILGKIKLDSTSYEHVFSPADESVELTPSEEASIAERLVGLNVGVFSIAMQDDD